VKSKHMSSLCSRDFIVLGLSGCGGGSGSGERRENDGNATEENHWFSRYRAISFEGPSNDPAPLLSRGGCVDRKTAWGAFRALFLPRLENLRRRRSLRTANSQPTHGDRSLDDDRGVPFARQGRLAGLPRNTCRARTCEACEAAERSSTKKFVAKGFGILPARFWDSGTGQAKNSSAFFVASPACRRQNRRHSRWRPRRASGRPPRLPGRGP
jgi:hypothetical protein